MIIRSMSRKGNCWDNSVAESFFKTLKTECVYQYRFTDKEQAALIVFEYIERLGITAKDYILRWDTCPQKNLEEN